MKKALIIGNGFTSNLINEFRNQHMMDDFYKKIPTLINRIIKEFDIFRNSSITGTDLYRISEAFFCGDNIYLGDNIYPSSDGKIFTNKVEEWILSKLINLNFPKPKETFKNFFITYGLIYLINQDKIVGIESYLKIVALFELIGRFS